MSNRLTAFLLTVLLALSGFCLADDKPGNPEKPAKAPAQAEKPDAKPDRYIRVLKKDNQPIALQTSILRFVPEPNSPLAAKGVTGVDLIGAVHIGEKSYYVALNKQFKKYDAMLYELVAPEGTVIPKGGGGSRASTPISALQSGMKSLLGLEFQLEQVDYTQGNFIHADMTPEEMSESMKKRGESVLKMLFRMMGQGFARQGSQSVSDADLLIALFSPDRPKRLKRLMAEQIVDMESLNAALAGPDGSSTLIGERNRKALEVMVREANAGKKRIAVFYGAGHLPDMERRLIKEHKLKSVGIQWLQAWDLR